MATRPVFTPGSPLERDSLINEIPVEFTWYPGLSCSQKQKSVNSMHEAASKVGYRRVLEISTKSLLPLGNQLSAFNLKLSLPCIGQVSVEAAFQGSKRFKSGGPFIDLLNLPGHAVKADLRLKESGPLVGFELFGEIWELEPLTAFYDWLYLNALSQNSSLAKQLFDFDGFSDIEFNPKKAINCQARAAALYVALRSRNLLDQALSGKKYYLDIIIDDSRLRPRTVQLPFLDADH